MTEKELQQQHVPQQRANKIQENSEREITSI